MSHSDGPEEAYRAIPDTDGERAGTDGVEADGAAEKLLSKEREARVVSGMADAKYKSAERNGEAKIEIDAAKRTFTGLTKEELLKYQDDPFWVRLRWSMFVLFWALWLCMLAGAIAIIIKSPKCPQQKTQYEKSPILDLEQLQLKDVEERLPLVEESGVHVALVSSATIGPDIYDEGADLEPLRQLVDKAGGHHVKLIVDIVANNVKKTHPWFLGSEKKEENYVDYFIWADGKPDQQPPNNWVSLNNEPAWSYSDSRKQYYLHQLSSDTADLNFRNQRVVAAFEAALQRILSTGVGGIRLINGQQLLVDDALKDDTRTSPSDAVHTDYAYYSHRATSNRPELGQLLDKWRRLVQTTSSDVSMVSKDEGNSSTTVNVPDNAHTDTTISATTIAPPVPTTTEKPFERVLLLASDVPPQEPYLKGDEWAVSLPTASAISAEQPPEKLANLINRSVGYWPSIELVGSGELTRELAAWSLLLPATPVLKWEHVFAENASSWQVGDMFKSVNQLRQTSNFLHAPTAVQTLANHTLLAVTRRVDDNEGYLGVFNPGDVVVVDASGLPGVPADLSPLLEDKEAKLPSNSLHVPARSTSVFKFHIE